MAEPLYIEHEIADGWVEREAEKGITALEESLMKHALFEAFYVSYLARVAQEAAV